MPTTRTHAQPAEPTFPQTLQVNFSNVCYDQSDRKKYIDRVVDIFVAFDETWDKVLSDEIHSIYTSIKTMISTKTDEGMFGAICFIVKIISSQINFVDYQDYLILTLLRNINHQNFDIHDMALNGLQFLSADEERYDRLVIFAYETYISSTKPSKRRSDWLIFFLQHCSPDVAERADSAR
uniref:Cnd1 domain-containing protein n=1 Tax=Panagrellus redivivus TaxID=6233 RepID=A0A7E4W9G1_PANRE